MGVKKWVSSGLGFDGFLESSGESNKGLLVYITKGVKASTAGVSVIVYFHGNYQSGTTNLQGLREHYTSNEFFLALRDIDKPLVLVLPELSASPSTSDWVATSRAKFNSVIEDALLMAAQYVNELNAGRPLRDESKHHKTGDPVDRLKLDKLIMSAHSGGGWPMRKARDLGSDYMKHLKEIWMLDSLYDEAPAWMDWAALHTNVTFRNTFTKGRDNMHAPFLNSSKIYEPSRKGEVWPIQKPPAIRPPIHNLTPTIESPVDHHRVPGKFLPEWIRQSSNL
jgi:hypothetical protein